MSQHSGPGHRFVGKVAVVTGGSRGIGLGIAQRLLSEGACVVITGRKQEPLDEALTHLDATGRSMGVAGKADNPEHQQETIDAAVSTFGSIDLLVNNAGINPVFGPMMELDLGAARKILEVNCLGALAWTQLAYRAWMRDHGGSVVNIASTSGVRPAPGLGIYGSSKAMLMHLTTNLALELAPGIRVNAVAPSVIKTRFAEALYDGREDEVAAHYPLARLGVPADVADTVAFLLSNEASWITGQTLVIDGGLMMRGGE